MSKKKEIDINGSKMEVEFKTVTTATVHYGESTFEGQVVLGPKDTFVRSRGNKYALAVALKDRIDRPQRKEIWDKLFEKRIVDKEVSQKLVPEKAFESVYSSVLEDAWKRVETQKREILKLKKELLKKESQ